MCRHPAAKKREYERQNDYVIIEAAHH